MLADLIILALIIAFVSVAKLGHILLGVALLAGRANQRASDNNLTSGPATVVMPPNAANPQSTRRKLAA